jgi:hypothetical protein
MRQIAACVSASANLFIKFSVLSRRILNPSEKIFRRGGGVRHLHKTELMRRQQHCRSSVSLTCANCLVLARAEKHMHFPRCRGQDQGHERLHVARFFQSRSCLYNLIDICRPGKCAETHHQGGKNDVYNCEEDRLLASGQRRDTNTQKYLCTPEHRQSGVVSKFHLMVHLLCAKLRLAEVDLMVAARHQQQLHDHMI